MRLCAALPQRTAAAIRLCTTSRTNSTSRRVQPTMALTLYANPACPWAQRGYIALKEAGTPFEYKTIDLGPQKPAEFTELYRSIVPDDSTTGKVPVLIDGDLKITESAVVATYVANKFGKSIQLVPQDPAAAAKAALWVEVFPANVFGPVMAMLGSESQQALEAARAKLTHGLQVADGVLRIHGSEEGGFYVLGGQYSIAEVLTTSLLQRAVIFGKAHRQTDLWEMVREAKLDRLERWMAAALERPSAKETLPEEETLVEHALKFVKEIKN